MGSTFQSLLDSFITMRDDAHGSDNPSERIDNIESTVQAMLELLRDKLDRK